MIGDSNDEINFPYKLLFTDTQTSSLHKAFANDSSGNINFSKTQVSKMVHLGNFGSFQLLFPLFNPAEMAKKYVKKCTKAVRT